MRSIWTTKTCHYRFFYDALFDVVTMTAETNVNGDFLIHPFTVNVQHLR